MRAGNLNSRNTGLRSNAVNIGKQAQLTLAGVDVNGVVSVARETQLISMQQDRPRQWVVTLQQPTRTESLVNPWLSSDIDGGEWVSDYPPGVFTAPDLAGTSPMRVALRWGAGGASFQTEFDYPMAGAAFGVTADTFNLNVLVLPQSFANIGLVPTVGAFMVPGIAADPSPLTWQDVPATINASAAVWAVKPFARRVRVNVDFLVDLVVTWYDRGANPILQEFVNLATAGEIVQAFELPVCPQAVAMVVRSSEEQVVTIRPTWRMGLV